MVFNWIVAINCGDSTSASSRLPGSEPVVSNLVASFKWGGDRSSFCQQSTQCQPKTILGPQIRQLNWPIWTIPSTSQVPRPSVSWGTWLPIYNRLWAGGNLTGLLVRDRAPVDWGFSPLTTDSTGSWPMWAASQGQSRGNSQPLTTLADQCERLVGSAGQSRGMAAVRTATAHWREPRAVEERGNFSSDDHWPLSAHHPLVGASSGGISDHSDQTDHSSAIGQFLN